MKPECAAAVARVLGREPTKGELDSIEERIHGSMVELRAKDPARWSTLSRENRLQEGAKLARQKTLEDVTRAHSAKLRDMEIKAREVDNLGRAQAGFGKNKGQLNALNQRTLFDARLGGHGSSLESDVNAVHNDLARQLEDFGGKGKFFGAIQDPTEQHNLVRAIFGEDTGKPEVNAAGANVRKVLDLAHQRAVDAGINIHRLDNWNLPQPTAWERVGARQDEFVNDAMANIDPTKYTNRDGSPMSEKEIRSLVEASAETLGTNGANKRQEQGAGYGGKVGANRNAPRQLHYRDAAAYQAMMDKYGKADNVYSLVTQHLRGMARDIATAERFGRDADTFFPQLANKAFLADVDAVKKSDASPKRKEEQLKKLEAQKASTLKMYTALRRPDSPGTIPLWAKVSSNIRGVANATLQGGFLGAIPDLQMATGYMHLRGVARTKVLAHIAEGFNPTAENIKRINRLGIVNSHIDASVHRFGNEELGTHGVRFLNHAVHVAGGLRMFDRGMTHGVAGARMDMLGDHVSAGTEFSKLAPEDAKWMDQHGVTKDHWDTWRQADVETGPHGGSTMLTPDAIYSIPDEKLQPRAEAIVTARGDKPTAENVGREIRNLRSGAAKQLLSAVLAETKIGARGGSGTSLRGQESFGGAMSASNRGTLSHELAAWALLLKQTPLGIFKTHMMDVPNSLDSWGAAQMYRAKFMAGSAALGALGVELKNLALGNDPEDLTSRAGLGKIMLASGGFGMYGDLMFGDSGDHKNGTLTKMLGPGATMIEDVLNLAKNAVHTAEGTAGLEDEPGEPKAIPADKLGMQAVQFAHSYVAPLTRIWYVKAALNHLIYQRIMENMAPGYSQRVESRMAQRNQATWWPTGQALPERAPNLGGVVGQPAQ